jgi:hypothetical protein
MDEIIFGFPPLHEALDHIGDLDEHQFALLLEAVASQQGFKRSFSRSESLANQLQGGLSTSDVFNILGSLNFLYDNSRKWEDEEKTERETALGQFLEFTGLNSKLNDKFGPKIFDRLNKLTAANPAIQRRNKIRKLKSGLLDTATGFASFVDLRPRFTTDRGVVEELVPITILRVELRTEYGPDKSCVFQLSTDGLSKLTQVISDIEKKLSAIKRDTRLSERLINESVEESDD